jgi:hypothetical protein
MTGTNAFDRNRVKPAGTLLSYGDTIDLNAARHFIHGWPIDENRIMTNSCEPIRE